MTHAYLTGARRPRVLAHRGLVTGQMAADGLVENSVAAIAAAHAVGAEYVESDCRLTSDGAVVLFHDDTLERVTGDPRRVSEVTLHELAELMAPRGGLALLEDVLRDFPDTRFNIDVKTDDAAAPAGRIVSEHAERVLLTSFSDERRRIALQSAAPARPATSAGSSIIRRLVLSTAVGARRRAGRLLDGIDALQIPERQNGVRVLTPRLLRWAHEHGVEIHVWTVDDVPRMRRLLARGVDGIVTNRADAALVETPA
ncbi:glycerophosphodiester phosphodiesterase family protein [Microbacterium betulae]|uniref:Glycerophosphodiester phosphodiesterase family protein n=1 Tax=Microbacterium betulae TaxID=2981139 RepID=A0AA97FE54_9MICO|nr:glycerophosphodiester phosphodiesterase family protein [Microbacterium sp. AB]WOF21473.1 glycerophosphodiester phosphodiesterase family protein [Microbacterium sp. AB]